MGFEYFTKKQKSPKNEVNYKGIGSFMKKIENLPKMRQIIWVLDELLRKMKISQKWGKLYGCET